jgi:autotransporter-associated beta strand protein
VWSWSAAPGVVYPGDTVHTVVRLTEYAESLLSANITVKYTTAALDLTNGASGTDITRSDYITAQGWPLVKNVLESSGTAYVTVNGTVPLASPPLPLELVSIDFRVPSSAPAGPASINLQTGTAPPASRLGYPGVPAVNKYVAATNATITVAGTSGTRTWVGGGTNDNWSTGENWSGGVAPGTGDDLVFSGTNRKTPFNESSGRNLHSIAVSDGYAISGSAVTLDAKGETAIQNVASGNTISLGVNLGSNGTVLVSGGSLAVDGPIGTGGNQLTFDTAVATVAHVGGQINGGGRLVKKGAGTLELAVGNYYTGGTAVDEGTLLVTDVGALPEGGALTIGARARVVLGSNLTQAAQQSELVVGALAATPAATSVAPQQEVCTEGLDQVDQVVNQSTSSMPARRVESLSRKTQVENPSMGPERPIGNPSSTPISASGVDRLAWLWGLDLPGGKGKAGGKDHAPDRDAAEAIVARSV